MPLKIYRRKGSPVWHYRGTLAGHRLRGSTRTSNKETAQEAAAKVEDEFWKHRLHGPEAVLTFPKAAAIYLGAGKPQRFIAKVVKYWGDAKVKDITSGAIQQAAVDLYPDATNATRNRCVIVPTQAIINHCAERSLCPPIRVRRFKVETKVKKPATLEWVTKFRAHAPAELGALAMFMFATGARISEALAVEWEDVDLKRRVVLIRQTKIGEEREAHLPVDLFIAMANLPREQKPFPWPYKMAAWRAWERVCVLAGIEALTFHSCRHGFATGLLHRGVDPVTVAKRGGWKTPAHVFATYGHAREDKKVTDLLFDTPADTAKRQSEENQ
ncbi:site-specific integrase [Bradyrhizobium daqingense]|uniref:Phage integrase family protein n=1 Tax=Bradyrhizobium daqingense TaxID=993502 RepID=A0A562LBX6_9BRAD|nr:site-specific integrase [Bradyrhizobium daqingense]TWI05130.1 phage integrase family protein [Bradyrhizobium daqingense]UFS86750.1 site-specific integrase [Bradyrhizobium daqingense]